MPELPEDPFPADFDPSHDYEKLTGPVVMDGALYVQGITVQSGSVSIEGAADGAQPILVFRFLGDSSTAFRPIVLVLDDQHMLDLGRNIQVSSVGAVEAAQAARRG